MKSTGVVRKVDELGRIVIPIELRRTLSIHEKDPLEIFVEEDKIILRKYESAKVCQITGEVSGDNLSLANGKIVLSREGAKKLIQELEESFLVK
ncbi:AbrB/MazE/SpoVT family DNA-binding domain-containing protein [Bacillus sp. FJAT-47783]|uniref:AbrB/MazE/SpoVT family DNA-binding domain-containing protein n=1 Tax=Bacillus sp. FJAT-47783 TaxID=2922712 RepID=UPI001FAD35D5|nr:AbrB/MazE/SpoVT family DNA-binding domain-containing protein [Bacillus sp. FJAT-47783]